MGDARLVEQISILLEQIFIMFLLMALGFFLYRKKYLDDATTKKLSNLLAKFTTPAVIIVAFQRDFDAKMGKTLLVLMICAFLSLGVSALIVQFLFRPAKHENYGSRRMCAIFSNDGFMAFPLLQGMFGSTGIFFGSAHIVANTIMMWTYGVWQLTHDKTKTNLKTVLVNPGTISLVAGILLFISPVKLPQPVFQAVSTFGAINTPVAMLVLGSFVAQANLPSALRSLDIWKISMVKLLFIPVILLIPLLFVPVDLTACIVLLIGIATPVAVTVATFAQLFDSDYLYSTRAIAVSTLLSAVTLPLLVALFSTLRALLF